MANLKNLKSKTKIQNALVDCLNKTRMSSMSVKMICDEAQVNRSTFYRHYDSIDSAISITISAYFSLLFGEPYKFYLKHQSIDESQYYISNNIFSHVYHDAYFYKTMFQQYSNFELLFKNHIQQRYITFFKDTGLENDMLLTKEIVADYIASAYVGMIHSWILRDFQETPETMARQLIILNSNGPIRLLVEAKKRQRD